MPRRFAAVLLFLALPMAVAPHQLPTGTRPLAGTAAPQGVTLKLDHVPIAVNNLTEAERDYREKLGFSIKPGRLHPNSIDNRHIRFSDGTALELITADRSDDALAGWYVDFLRVAEGGAFLAFTGAEFGRITSMLADNYTLHETAYVSTLTASPSSKSYPLFFVDTHSRAPDLPGHLNHANTALGLRGVWLASDWAADTAVPLLRRFGARVCPGLRVPPNETEGTVVRLAGGDVYLTGTPASHPDGKIVGVTIAVRDVDRALAALDDTVKESARTHVSRRGQSVMIGPLVSHGMWIEFLQASAATSPGDKVC